MKVNVLSAEGEIAKKIELPACFGAPIRPDLIAQVWRAQLIAQLYGAYPLAGKEVSIRVSHRRRKYKTLYGMGISRVPKKVLTRRGERFYWRGALMPGTVGGRPAHPPKAIKRLIKINKKVRRAALRGAIAATGSAELIKRKYRKKLELPLVIESALLEKKPREAALVLRKLLGLRARKRKVRPGKGKRRGRKYRRPKKVLIITSSKESALKLRGYGFDCARVNQLNVPLLAQGGSPGRLAVWTEGAIKELAK